MKSFVLKLLTFHLPILQVQLQLGDALAAEADARMALQLDPQNAKAQHRLAKALEAQVGMCLQVQMSWGDFVA